MNRFGVAALALMLGAGAARAADYPQYPMPGVVPYALPAASIWQGPYFGANFGWGSGKFEAEIGGLRGSLDADGALGGVHAGYSFQSGPVVFGVEADAQIAGISGGWSAAPLASLDGKLTWFSTLRGRVGFVLDNFLLYGTGGLAIGGAKGSATVLGLSASETNTHLGWTLGAGLEMALNHELSARFEYLYADFGKESYGGVQAGLKAHIFRAGATAHF